MQTASHLAPQLEHTTLYRSPKLRILADFPQNGQGFKSKFAIKVYTSLIGFVEHTYLPGKNIVLHPPVK